MLKFKSAFIAMAILILSSTAQAQEFTAAGAEEIKTELQGWLDRQIALATSNKTLGAAVTSDHIATSGELTVTPEADYYAAKLPFLTYHFEDGDRFELGQIALNIIPDGDDLWRMTMALPKTMKMLDAADTPRMTVHLGPQRFGGIWNTNRDIYIRYEGDYRDLRIETQDTTQTSSIDRLQIMQNLQPSDEAEDLYSGPMKAVISNLDLTLPDDAGRLQIESMNFDQSYSAMPLFDSNRFEEQLLAFNDNPGAQTAEFMATVFSLFELLPQETTGNMEIRNLEFTGTGENADQQITLGRFNLDMEAEDLQSDTARIDVSYNITDFAASGMAKNAYGAYIPSDATLNLNLSNFALKTIVERLGSVATAAFSEDMDLTEEQRMLLLMQTGASIPEILVENGLTVNLDGTRFQSEKLSTEIDGTIRGMPSAANGYAGNIRMGVRGLDQAALDLQRMIKADPDNKAFLQQLFLASTIAQGLGQPGPDGKTRLYDFELREDGQILLNGLNFSDLLGSQLH